jgi:hypothetical protein
VAHVLLVDIFQNVGEIETPLDLLRERGGAAIPVVLPQAPVGCALHVDAPLVHFDNGHDVRVLTEATVHAAFNVVGLLKDLHWEGNLEELVWMVWHGVQRTPPCHAEVLCSRRVFDDVAPIGIGGHDGLMMIDSGRDLKSDRLVRDRMPREKEKSGWIRSKAETRLEVSLGIL